ISTNLAGVGMVRASLNDMVKYAQAELQAGNPVTQRMRMTQQPLANGYAMNWAYTKVKGHDLVLHEGGTGGFSSIVALEPAKGRAVVVLADTLLADMGGLSNLGLPLLGVDVPLGTPRIAIAIPPELRTAMVGEWELSGLGVKV